MGIPSKTAAAALLLALTACANTTPLYMQEMPKQSVVADPTVYSMSRAEVISAIKECETSKTKAVMVYAKRLVGGVPRDMVVDVTCAPLYNF